VLSQTCKLWNDILNKIPKTANPIWNKIVRRFYDRYDSQDYRHLESIDSQCMHDSNTEWRMLLYIERVAGEVGQRMKWLAWVFRSYHIIPYNNIFQKEVSVEKTKFTVEKTTRTFLVCAKDYWHSLGVMNNQTRERGIDHFDIDFTEESKIKTFKDKWVFVHYLDHDYTKANFVSECRFIHLWFHVCGFWDIDYVIYRPRRVNKKGPMRNDEGHIMVRITQK